MMKLTGIGRIHIGFVTLCLTAILLANAVGVIPDDRIATSNGRAKVCEALAISASYLVSRNDLKQVRAELEVLHKRNEEIVSVGLRRSDGRLLAELGDHDQKWTADADRGGDGCYVVPISGPGGKWGELEVKHTPLFTGVAAYVNPSLLKLLLVFLPIVTVLSGLHLRRLLQHLDPSRVVPTRVRQTLDSFAEGVLLLDNQNRIVLANKTLASHVKVSPEDLVGRKAGDLPWTDSSKGQEGELPWQITRRRQVVVRGAPLEIEGHDQQERRVFSVNSVPVLDDGGQYQGALAAFADITPLEDKRAELTDAMDALRRSRDEIRSQNEELRYLATRDSLTSCLNRRTFFEEFEAAWTSCKGSDGQLCCAMIDIDFFKSINDNHGHSAGDQVLRVVGAELIALARDTDVVCRYGGEEFCVLMPDLDLNEAAAAAERVRDGLARLEFPAFSITASLGVSSIELGAADPHQLLDEADQCLYAAKRNGRNQVARLDSLPSESELSQDGDSLMLQAVRDADVPSVPYHAVTALLSSLSYRDPATAAHSKRVADLSGLLAQQVVSQRNAYLIEIAGLLHDIGKVGVPDAILLKPGPLTDDEWKIMSRHDRIGVEIINSSFKCSELTEIVQHHHAWYDGSHCSGDAPHGEAIPIGSRIVSIVDAYDAMVSDRPYRKGTSVESALAELRRCAGSQFDPDLVEQFCAIAHLRPSDLRSPDAEISQDMVLSIGQQVERIVEVLEEENRESFVALTDRLRSTAEQANLHQIATVASQASERAEQDEDLTQVVVETHELLDICRSIRDVLVEPPTESPAADEAVHDSSSPA